MAKCKSGKCGHRARIVSNVVQNMKEKCVDVCANPVCGTPNELSIMAPLIYDEIGINLCTIFDIGVDIPTEYPTVTCATIKVVDVDYSYGDEGVLIEAITGRPNCYVVTLSNISVTFALNLYDASGRLVTTLFPTALYLPSDVTEPTYDEDTNPTSVELEIFAPYGVSYTPTGGTPIPVLNFLGFMDTNNFVRQGLNLYSIPKLIDFDVDDSTVTVGLTMILQSLYFAGYRVESVGRINTPKGSLETSEESDCMRFVAGDLLNLEIKPLELGVPLFEECLKEECEANCGCDNAGKCGQCVGTETIVLPGIIETPPVE